MKSMLWLLAAALLPSAAVPTRAQAPDYIASGSTITRSELSDPALRAQLIEEGRRNGLAQDQKFQAKEALEKGDMATAFSLLQQSVHNNPIDGMACVLLAYFYVQKGQPANVIATLDPIVNFGPYNSHSTGREPTTRMIYVLAQLDRYAWKEAVACYEQTWRPRSNPIFGAHAESHLWDLPGGGPVHSWPDLKFSADVPDYTGMRAQAHLIIGTTLPDCMEEKDQYPYMLDHLKQVLRINPNSLDAHFVSGWLLGKTARFAEARIEYALAARFASPDAQKEITAELTKLKDKEESVKRFQTSQAARASKAK